MNRIPVGSEALKTDCCYVCDSRCIRNFRDHKGFRHLICDDCHLMRLHPDHFIPGTDLYKDSYFNGQLFHATGGRIGYPGSYSDPTQSHRSYQYSAYIKEILSHLPDKPEQPLRMLDFGCGYGEFLKTLQEHMGDKVEVHGIDVDPEVCAKASSQLNGAPVYYVDLREDNRIVPCSYFDAVTLLDVVEHLQDPRVYLKRLSECAAADGYLLLSTPNIESFNARLYGDRWILHGPPYHMYYFGPHSIRILLQQSGWKILKLYTERTIFHNERYSMETWRGRITRLMFENRLCDTLTNRVFRIGSIMTVLGCRS